MSEQRIQISGGPSVLRPVSEQNILQGIRGPYSRTHQVPETMSDVHSSLTEPQKNALEHTMHLHKDGLKLLSQ